MTRAGTGAAHQAPTRAETEIAARRGLRTAAAGAAGAGGPLGGGGLPRAARSSPPGWPRRGSRSRSAAESEQRPGTWLGVTFSTPDYTDAAGVPVAFSGRTLARDLTAPGAAGPLGRPGRGRRPRAGRGTHGGLVDALAAAAPAAGRGPAALRGQVAAGADALWAAAEAVEADRGGALAHRRRRRPPAPPASPGRSTAPAAARITGLLDGIADAAARQHRGRNASWPVLGVFMRLLRAWAQADRGEAARAAAATAAA